MACAYTHRQHMVECDDTARNKLYRECAAATLVAIDAMQHVHITQAERCKYKKRLSSSAASACSNVMQHLLQYQQLYDAVCVNNCCAALLLLLPLLLLLVRLVLLLRPADVTADAVSGASPFTGATTTAVVVVRTRAQRTKHYVWSDSTNSCSCNSFGSYGGYCSGLCYGDTSRVALLHWKKRLLVRRPNGQMCSYKSNTHCQSLHSTSQQCTCRTCERPAAAVASKALRASASAESAAPVSAIACATLALAAAMRAVRLAYVGTDEVICLLAFLVVAALQHMAHSANQQ
eukprot:3194-Heterococcus_DN1.PRE.6